jgi:hypothetical protein
MLRTAIQTLVRTATKQNCFWILVVLICLYPTSTLAANTSQFSTISNGVIEVGVDLNAGGSIGYVAQAGTHGNIVNIHDFGRYCGQSYYSGPQPFGNPAAPYSNCPWNAVSAGDFYGNASTVVTSSNDGNMIYVKSVPKQWALNNVASECTFETWISLDNNAVLVDNRLVNSRSDVTQYPAFTQETPAVYTTGRFWQLFSYTGAQPFTGDALTQIQNAAGSWAKFPATEGWAAAVDNTGWGLGCYHPDDIRYAAGFQSLGWQPGTGGPFDPPTSYLGPHFREIIDNNIIYNYRYYLVLGTLNDIRNYVYSKNTNTLPNYVFASDRQHFFYVNATDSGWPIAGHLHVNLGQDAPQVVGPTTAWRAEQVPSLYVKAAYHLAAPSKTQQGILALSYLGGTNSVMIPFNVIADDQYHTYQVNLAGNPAHHGLVTNLTFYPVGNGASSSGDSVDLMSISNSASPTPTPPPSGPPGPPVFMGGN